MPASWVTLPHRASSTPSFPAQTEEIVSRALQRNPADRYASAAAMKAEIDTVDQVRVSGLADRLQKPAPWAPSFFQRPWVLAAAMLGSLLEHERPTPDVLLKALQKKDAKTKRGKLMSSRP